MTDDVMRRPTFSTFDAASAAKYDAYMDYLEAKLAEARDEIKTLKSRVARWRERAEAGGDF